MWLWRTPLFVFSEAGVNTCVLLSASIALALSLAPGLTASGVYAPLSRGILLLSKPPITARRSPDTGSAETPTARSYTCSDWLGLRGGSLYRVFYAEGRSTVPERSGTC